MSATLTPGEALDAWNRGERVEVKTLHGEWRPLEYNSCRCVFVDGVAFRGEPKQPPAHAELSEETKKAALYFSGEANGNRMSVSDVAMLLESFLKNEVRAEIERERGR